MYNMHDVQIHHTERTIYSPNTATYYHPCDKLIVHLQRELTDDQLGRIINIILEGEECDTESA